MRTQVYFYSFDSKAKPGKIICHGIRFESLEVRNDAGFNTTSFKILCDGHDELSSIPLKHFRNAVVSNFNRHANNECAKEVIEYLAKFQHIKEFGYEGHLLRVSEIITKHQGKL